MRAYEKERPRKSFIMPNESFKWDFILEKYVTADDAERAGAIERQKAKRADDGFDKDFIVTHRRRKLHDRYY
ncbi:MAG: hypothetical protein ACXVIG_05585 [Halobacteriota archaeon]